MKNHHFFDKEHNLHQHPPASSLDGVIWTIRRRMRRQRTAGSFVGTPAAKFSQVPGKAPGAHSHGLIVGRGRYPTPKRLLQLAGHGDGEAILHWVRSHLEQKVQLPLEPTGRSTCFTLRNTPNVSSASSTSTGASKYTNICNFGEDKSVQIISKAIYPGEVHRWHGRQLLC